MIRRWRWWAVQGACTALLWWLYAVAWADNTFRVALLGGAILASVDWLHGGIERWKLERVRRTIDG